MQACGGWFSTSEACCLSRAAVWASRVMRTFRREQWSSSARCSKITISGASLLRMKAAPCAALAAAAPLPTATEPERRTRRAWRSMIRFAAQSPTGPAPTMAMRRRCFGCFAGFPLLKARWPFSCPSRTSKTHEDLPASGADAASLSLAARAAVARLKASRLTEYLYSP